MTTADPLACTRGPHPVLPNVHDVSAALAREQAKSARLWGLLRAKGMTDDQIHIRITPPQGEPTMATVRVIVRAQQGDVEVEVQESNGYVRGDNDVVNQLLDTAVAKVRRAYGIEGDQT